MREELRDKRNQRYGYIDKQLNGQIKVMDKNGNRLGEIKPEGSYLVAYDKNFRRLGKWYENDDCTYDANNRRLGKGNMLLSFYFD
jgi:hypothetical protein